MNRGQIDHISELKPESLTFANLKFETGTGVSYRDGSGKSHYRTGVETALGDIEESLWYKLMEQLIENSGETWLLDALIQWYKGPKTDKKELREHALQLHSYRIFDNPKWVEYLRFNRRYRPSVLEHAHIVTVITECCGIPGEITQEQVDAAYQGNIACPICGRESKFRLLKQEEKHDGP